MYRIGKAPQFLFRRKNGNMGRKQAMTIRQKIKLSNVMMALIPIMLTAIIVAVWFTDFAGQLLVYAGDHVSG